MPKPFLTFEAQISYLETDKNLVIQDHDYAKSMLKRIGYFSLIGGYNQDKLILLHHASLIHLFYYSGYDPW